MRSLTEGNFDSALGFFVEPVWQAVIVSYDWIVDDRRALHAGGGTEYGTWHLSPVPDSR